MNVKIRNIQVDAETADRLEARAAARGVSVSELVAELVVIEGEPIAAENEEIAELDRRWKAVEAGRTTIPHDEVVRWLQTWGTPAYRRRSNTDPLSSSFRNPQPPTEVLDSGFAGFARAPE